MDNQSIMTALMTIIDKLSGNSDVATNVYPGDDTRRFAPVTIQSTETEDEPPLDTMVPPLQQKLELLKKSVGVDNIFDGCDDDCDCDCCSGEEDELDLIRRHAGVIPNTTAIMAMTDDEPLD